MNEEITNEVQEDLITWIKEKIDGAEGFVLEQAPLYCQELLEYAWFYNVLALGFSIAFFLTLIILTIVAGKRRWFDKDVFWFSYLFFGGLLYIPILLGAINSTRSIIKIKTAPRVFILDYIK